jgi:hypothetical protein
MCQVGEEPLLILSFASTLAARLPTPDNDSIEGEGDNAMSLPGDLQRILSRTARVTFDLCRALTLSRLPVYFMFISSHKMPCGRRHFQRHLSLSPSALLPAGPSRAVLSPRSAPQETHYSNSSTSSPPRSPPALLPPQGGGGMMRVFGDEEPSAPPILVTRRADGLTPRGSEIGLVCLSSAS